MRSRPPREPRWSSTTAPSRCSARIDITDDPKRAFDGCQHRAAGRRPAAHQGDGARRPARGQRRHLQAAGRGDQRRRRRRHQGARGRQPGEHERPDRPGERPRRPARALHRDDAPRPQPRRRAARQQARGRRRRRQQHDRLGQPLADSVPRPRQREDRRRERLVGRRRRGLDRRRVHPAGRQARRRGHRGARRSSSAASAANAAIDHVHDWVLGTPEGDWVSMARPERRLLRRSSRGPHLAACRAAAADGEYAIVEGLEITDFSRERIDASVAELRSRSATRSPSSGSSEPGRGPR